MVEGWKAVVFQPGYGASEAKDAECGELKGVRLQSLVKPMVELG